MNILKGFLANWRHFEHFYPPPPKKNWKLEKKKKKHLVKIRIPVEKNPEFRLKPQNLHLCKEIQV